LEDEGPVAVLQLRAGGTFGRGGIGDFPAQHPATFPAGKFTLALAVEARFISIDG